MAVALVDRDRGFAALMHRARQAEKARIKVGVLGDAIEPISHLTVGEVAVIQEFGTSDGRIPSRPFVRSTFDRERDRLAEMGRKLVEEVIDGKIKVPAALDVLGLYLANAMKRTITGGLSPPNAPSTLIAKARKSKKFVAVPKSLGQAIGNAGVLSAVKPLIDTGRLLNSISWAIVTGEE